MLDSNFYPKLIQVAGELGMNPRDLLLVMYVESGLNPHIPNLREGGAYGLIQMTDSTLHGMGLNRKDIINSTASEQLDYVKRYVQAQANFIGHPFHSATEYYHANFFPLTLKRWHGTDPEANRDVVVVSSKAKSSTERQAYTHNSGLDFNRDGIITVGDLSDYLMSKAQAKGFQQALANLNTVAGQGNVSELSKDHPYHYQTPKSSLHKTPDEPTKEDSSWLISFVQKLEHFLSSFATQNRGTLISLGCDDPVAKLEFAEILQLALQEELSISSSIHKNGTQIELQYNQLNHQEQNIVRELCDVLIDEFSIATKKIGNIKVHCKIINCIASTYPEVDIKVSEINHRKFLLKFANKTRKDAE